MKISVKNILWRVGALLLAAAIMIVVWIMWANRNPDLQQSSFAPANAAEQIKRGDYLARAGNCMSCHTARGGQPYAGGRAVPTPFGNIYTSNLTTDRTTGIGNWSNDDFWRAMHDGRSKDGTLLYPAFPYPSYTHVTRADSDAIFAYLRTVPAVTQQNIAPELRFPYDQRVLLYAWRALYFRPGQYVNDAEQSVEWNRGAYLTQGLGHCAACHSPRDGYGGTNLKTELSGGMIPMLNWYAPPLNGDHENGLGNWKTTDLAAFLKHGTSSQRAVSGPMAEVVGSSLQYLHDDDVNAMAVYLKSLPQQTKPSPRAPDSIRPEDKKTFLERGQKIYDNQCASCHQANGEGVSGIYPAFAGSNAIRSPIATNAIRIVLNGGYPPSTGGNPRPYGMPPFGQTMNDEDVAAVVSYIRNAWGNQAGVVSSSEVNRTRSRQGE
jgi:mono/diheme cytochrome c family protein